MHVLVRHIIIYADEFLVIAFGYHLLHLGLRKPYTLMKCNKVTPTYTLHRYIPGIRLAHAMPWMYMVSILRLAVYIML